MTLVISFLWYHCRYEYYYALLRDFPEVHFTLNGGLTTIDQVSDYLTSDYFLLSTNMQGWERHILILLLQFLEVGICITMTQWTACSSVQCGSDFGGQQE
jgi:hypothetical protein